MRETERERRKKRGREGEAELHFHTVVKSSGHKLLTAVEPEARQGCSSQLSLGGRGSGCGLLSQELGHFAE